MKLQDGYYWYWDSPDDPLFVQADSQSQIVEVWDNGMRVTIMGVEETVDITEMRGRFHMPKLKPPKASPENE